MWTPCLLALDGTECPVQRPRDYQKQRALYSGKECCHTLKYEVAVRITDGLPCWVAGPFLGSRHDIAMLQHYRLEGKLLQGELLLADRGYQGSMHCVTPYKRRPSRSRVFQCYTLTPVTDQHLSEAQREFNLDHSSIREVVEHTNSRIKAFNSMSIPWRHALELHPSAFRVIVAIITLEAYYSPIHSEPNQYLFIN